MNSNFLDTINYNYDLFIKNANPQTQQELKVKLIKQDGTIQEISAKTFNPNQVGLWKSWTSWFKELFTGKTFAEIKLNDNSVPIYIKINELVQKGILTDKQQQKDMKAGITTSFIKDQYTFRQQKTEKMAKEIQAFATQKGIGLNSYEKEIADLFKQLGPDALGKAKTFIEVLAAKKQAQDFATHIGFNLKPANDQEINDIFTQSADPDKGLKVAKEYIKSLTDKEIQDFANRIGLKLNSGDQKFISGLLNLEKGLEKAKKHIESLVDQEILTFAKQKKINLLDSDKQHIQLLLSQENGLEQAKKHIEVLAKPKSTFEIFAKLKQTAEIKEPTQETTSQTKSPASQKQEMPQAQDEIYATLKKFGFNNSKNRSFLKSLSKVVPYESLQKTLNSIESEEEKAVMFRTFLAIGKALTNSSIIPFFNTLKTNQLTYVGSEKVEGKTNQRLTHAFAINNLDILIIPKKDPLGKGSFKVVSEAIKLNDLSAPIVRLKVKPDEKGNDLNKTQALFDEVQIEQNLLQEIHEKGKEDRSGGRSCIVPPIQCRIITGIAKSPKSKKVEKAKKKLIMFQHKLDGEGTKLIGAPAIQQAYALRDCGKGLAYLHSLNCVHMDVKPANLLLEGKVDDQIPIKAKVADFGMTVKKDENVKGGTPRYLPGEVIHLDDKGRIYFKSQRLIATPAIDSFSYGVTIFDVLKTEEKDHLLTFGLLTQKEIDDQFNIRREQIINSSLSSQDKKLKLGMLDISNKLIRQKPNERISCQEAVKQMEKFLPKVQEGTESFNGYKKNIS